jgi:hypothetical protein
MPAMQSAQPVAANAVTRIFALRTRKEKHNFVIHYWRENEGSFHYTDCNIIFVPLPVFSYL